MITRRRRTILQLPQQRDEVSRMTQIPDTPPHQLLRRPSQHGCYHPGHEREAAFEGEDEECVGESGEEDGGDSV